MAAKRVRNHKSSGTQIPHAERRGVRIELYVPDDVAERIDAARGEQTRAAWLRAAIEAALG